MHQGDPGDQLLVLLAGHVKASTIDSRGREVVLAFRGPGDVLGELTFTRAEPRSSDVTAIEPVEARVISAAQFRAFLEQRPSAALTLIEVIGGRFRDANVARMQFADLDTIGRVAARLIELCRALRRGGRGGRPDPAADHAGRPRQLDRLLAGRRCQRPADDARARLDQDGAPADHPPGTAPR